MQCDTWLQQPHLSQLFVPPHTPLPCCMLLHAPWQTKKGELALSYCAEEYVDILREFRDNAIKVLEEAYNYDQERIQANPPLFMFDGASAHTDWDKVLDVTDRAPHPARSPDINNPIEHTWNHGQTSLQNRIIPALIFDAYTQGATDPAKHYSPIVWTSCTKQAVRGTHNIEMIRKDIEKMPDTCQSIIERDGAMAAHGLN